MHIRRVLLASAVLQRLFDYPVQRAANLIGDPKPSFSIFLVGQTDRGLVAS